MVKFFFSSVTIIVLSFFALSNILVAQNPVVFYENVVPPSPNAASLGKYGEIPVDKFRGIPSISIPLYTIQVDDINIPISISFHASGHKVGEKASWVGLGWSLNAGGVVTRSMKGGPDEGGYFFNINKVLEWNTQSLLDYVYLLNTSSPAVSSIKQKMFEFYTDQRDIQPDLFFYNFPGGSGKFLFDPQQNIVQIPFQDYRITPTGLIARDNTDGQLDGFTIDDLNGLQYTFGEKEYSIVDYTQPGLSKPSDKYNSSWYLSSVYSRRSGKHVNFLYSGPLLQVGDPITSHSFVEFLPQAGVSPITLTSNQQISVPKNQVVHLEKIQWEGGEVRFLRSSGRIDLDGGQKLDAVEFRNSKGELIKSFQFGYSYFDTNKHLKLNSVTEKDALNNPMPPHTFEYLEGTMPASNSFAMDHFGFYNGKANPSLVPSFNNAFHNLITQADRSSDSQASMVGVLKKINYPAGGSTAFDYESNDYYSASAPTNIDTRENIVCSATAEKCDINGVLYYQPDGSAVIGLLCQSIVETSFISTQSGFDYQLILKANMNTSSPPVISSGDLVINLYRTDQSLIVPILTRGVTDDLEITENIASVISANVNYLLRVESKVLGVSLRATIVNKIAGLPVPGKSNSYLVSGIRLASMTHNNPSTSIPVRGFTYKYNLESDLAASSGVLMAKQPSYKYVYRQAADVHTSLGNYVVHQGSPKGLLGSLSDSHVVYSQVEEREVGVGSTRYIYSVTKGVPLPASIYTPTYYDHTSSSWKNGQLVAVKKFNEAGDLLSKQESIYSYPLKAVTKSFIFEADGIVNALPTYNSYRHHLFDQESGWTRLDQTINSSYANGQELKVVQNYNYADPSLVLPTSTESISSTGTILKEETSYLNNRTSYVISLPISKISYDRGSQVGKELFNYFSDFKLQSKEIFDRNNQLTKKTTLSNYNGLKPSFIQESNGSKQLFLWGYGQTLPVAVLTNADFGEAYYQGFEDNGTKGYAKTGESYLNSGSYTILSTDFAPINVSTLKMSYWFWEGGLWKFSGVLDYTPTISSTGSRLDEIRVYPKGSIMTTYTYRLGFGISSLTDANNNSTYYEYDDFARLTVVRDNSRRILKSTVYKYRGQ